MNSFDYIIIGAGAAGLSLANAMGKDSFFSKKSILLLDKNAKRTNDRTWCFWEKGEGDFDDILHKKWSSIQFAGQQIDQRYPIAPYEYKMIQGLDFYASMFKKLDEYPNITFLNEEVISVINTATVNTVKTANNTFIAATLINSIFDYK